LWDWRPNIVGADGEQYSFYLNEAGKRVGLYLGVYREQRQGAEDSTAAPRAPRWPAALL